MTEANTLSSASPLAEAFQRCSHSFKNLHFALFSDGSISLAKFNDEYGRFGVWGGDSGADRTGRGSLDDMLRNDKKTASIITELLENLEEDLKTCTAIAKAPSAVPETARGGQSPLGQDWLSDEDSSFSSGSDSGDSESGGRVRIGKTQRILHLLAIIVDHIRSLFQISTLLRRPTISDKYLRSLSKSIHQQPISPFISWDLAHVIEKRRCWGIEQEGHIVGLPNYAKDDPYRPDYLCKRLAAANVRRREQLSFWQNHPAQPSALSLPTGPNVPNEPVAKPNPSSSKPSEVIEKLGSKSAVSKPTQTTKHSFSTVAKSDLNDAATFSGRPRTEYASSVKGGKSSLRVRDVPKVAKGERSFKCPYCSTLLDVVSMSQRQVWKKHVFRDLRPYVCTFEHCENPEKLYLTRHDWIYHETQMHRRQWTCASCANERFLARVDLEEHMRSVHAGNFQESQLSIMVKICERPLDDDLDADCPLCPVTIPLSSLRAHLANHLEDLALFVLPLNMADHSLESGSDKAAGGPDNYTSSDVSHSESTLPEANLKPILHCTFGNNCSFSTTSFLRWKGHEASSTHWQQNPFKCSECPTVEPKYGWALEAEEFVTSSQLSGHLKSSHGTDDNILSAVVGLSRVKIGDNWPRQCGFCGKKFQSWDERADHLVIHFKQGLTLEDYSDPAERIQDPVAFSAHLNSKLATEATQISEWISNEIGSESQDMATRPDSINSTIRFSDQDANAIPVSTEKLDITTPNEVPSDRLTTYAVFRLQKAPPKNATDGQTWARCEVTQLHMSKSETRRHIEVLDEIGGTLAQKMASLKPDQEAQIEKLLDAILAIENNPTLKWSLAQFDYQWRAEDGDLEALGTSMFTLYFQRTLEEEPTRENEPRLAQNENITLPFHSVFVQSLSEDTLDAPDQESTQLEPSSVDPVPTGPGGLASDDIPSRSFGNRYWGLTFQQAQELIVADILNLKQEPGLVRSPGYYGQDDPYMEPFFHLPSRALKDYYQLIQTPMSLTLLQLRVIGVGKEEYTEGISEYDTWEAFEEAASLIWQNAYVYNEEGSAMYLLAEELEKRFKSYLREAKEAVPFAPPSRKEAALARRKHEDNRASCKLHLEKAIWIHGILERLAGSVFEEPEPKNPTTLGSVLLRLANDQIDDITDLDIMRISSSLQSCVRLMEAIIDLTKENLRANCASPEEDLGDIWRPEADLKKFAIRLHHDRELLDIHTQILEGMCLDRAASRPVIEGGSSSKGAVVLEQV